MSDVIPEYKMACTPDMSCVEVTFTNSQGDCPVHIRFTDKDVTVIGEYGCWVFKRNIVNPYRFFCGGHINPDYWAGKLEAAPRTYWERGVDEGRLRETILKMYGNSGVTEEDLEELESRDDSIAAWGDALVNLSVLKGWNVDASDLWSMVVACKTEDWCYLRVCELAQAASNYLKANGIGKD